MLSGLSSSAAAGCTPRSSALTLKPCTWISGADTVQAEELSLRSARGAVVVGAAGALAAAAAAGAGGGGPGGGGARRQLQKVQPPRFAHPRLDIPATQDDLRHLDRVFGEVEARLIYLQACQLDVVRGATLRLQPEVRHRGVVHVDPEAQ